MNRAISALDKELIRSGLLLIGALKVICPWTGSMHADKSLAITLTKGGHFAYIIIRFNTTKKMDAGLAPASWHLLKSTPYNNACYMIRLGCKLSETSRRGGGDGSVFRSPCAAHTRQKATRNHLRICVDLSSLSHARTAAMRTNECVAVLTSEWHGDEEAMWRLAEVWPGDGPVIAGTVEGRCSSPPPRHDGWAGRQLFNITRFTALL